MTNNDSFRNRATACEADDDSPRGPVDGEAIGEVIFRRYSRRDVMRGTLGVTAVAALFGPAALAAAKADAATATDSFDFAEVEAGINTTHHVADGYSAKPLLRWGDALVPDLPEFNPQTQSPADQLKRFGYNNDYIAYFPIDGSSTHGLLCINHEYTNEELMFPSLTERQDTSEFKQMTSYLVDLEMAAHGVTIVEVKKTGDDWQIVIDSPYNRRISPHTEMTADGPAAGTARLMTSADPSGKALLGTLNNCAGGKTPWDTYLAAEENFHDYFWTQQLDANNKPIEGIGGDQKDSYKRYKVPALWQAWGKFHDRFNVDKEENEPNRFGWIVEIDPFNLDPLARPVKHTALGRFCHEGAESLVNEKDGRVVVYCGDDTAGEYVYRFVSKGRFDPDDKASNMKLLSEGTLSVAQFKDDGTLRWLPLELGEPGLTKEDGWKSQQDILIDARLAGEAVGATRMDRPEDVQPNKITGSVYVMLTKNTSRTETDAANPRTDNAFGHIIEMVPRDGDHAADIFDWDILVRCGDPKIKEVGACWNAATSADGWFACPDNACVDSEGRLWIATDQGDGWPQTGRADGLFAMETDGIRRGTPKLFFRVPVGAEMCGPCFTPDGETLFVSVQHPGADGAEAFEDFKVPSTFTHPVTRWPDFEEGMPPRPSVMVITKDGGGKIG
ncbi:MAG TPA: PhoX family phosphatase [Methyloceanibacter sp.]|nr:PhoX family phosphatase [Methyloceanibacter sp.]